MFLLVGEAGLDDIYCPFFSLNWKLYVVGALSLLLHIYLAFSLILSRSSRAGLGTFNSANSLSFVLSKGKADFALVSLVTGCPYPGRICPVAIILLNVSPGHARFKSLTFVDKAISCRHYCLLALSNSATGNRCVIETEAS